MKKICIDPGHGGIHPGACYFGEKEKDLTLSISLGLRKHLTEAGFEVIMTRETDMDISLSDRCAISNREKCDLFLSIHCNASYNPKTKGIETYRYGGKSNVSDMSLCVAKYIQKHLVNRTGAKDGGVRSNTTFTTLRKTACPSLVLELGYLSNQHENLELTHPEYQELLILGIVDGITKCGLS